MTKQVETLQVDNAGLLLELAQVQARQDQADMLLMIVQGGAA
ncbi:hypothetical protein [Paenibacillus sp. FSL R10-2734]